MNSKLLMAIVVLEILGGLVLRWTIPGPWAPWALVGALFLVAITGWIWGKVERHLAAVQKRRPQVR